MIKAIFFDLDGTVANTNDLIVESFRHTFRIHGIEGVTDKEIYSFFGEPLLYTMKRFRDGKEADDMATTYRAFNETQHDAMIKDFPHVRETLEDLRNLGYKLGIVTSKRLPVAKKSLSALDLTDFFDDFITPEMTIRHKPDKEPVTKALEVFKVHEDEAVMVGDSPFDILSGNAAGVLTIGVSYSAVPREKIIESEPTFMIDDMKELLEIVSDINMGMTP